MIKKMITIYFLLLLSLSVTTGRQIAAEEGCVLQLHFDEGEGQVVKDSSGKNNNGEIFNAKWVEDGITGGALQFDGIKDYVECEGSQSLKIDKAITITCWVKPAESNPPAGKNYVLKKVHPDTMWGLSWGIYQEHSNDCFLFHFFTKPDGKVNSLRIGPKLGELILGHWCHLAIMYDATGMAKVYYNGELTGKWTKQHVKGDLETSGNPLEIGKYFKGVIDELRIYNRTLSDKEIKMIYHSEAGDSIKVEADQKGKLQEMKEGNLSVLLGNRGEIKEIRIKGETYARDIGLSIIRPSSRYTSNQFDHPYVFRNFGRQDDTTTEPRITRGMIRPEGRGKVFARGRILGSEPAYEYKGRDFQAHLKSFLFEESLEVTPEEVKISYKVIPDVSLEGLAVSLEGFLPVEDITTYVVHTSKFTRKGTFSELANNPDNLVYNGTNFYWIGWLLKDGKGIKIRPESGIWKIMLGKDKFNCFVPRIMLKARDPMKFDISIEPLTTSEVDRLIAKKENPLVSKGQLAINFISENNKRIGQYEKFEVTLDISATYSDIFDPDDIEIKGYFTSPSGITTEILGFPYQDYERDSSDICYLIPKGTLCWKIRFAPMEKGTYKYHVTVKDRSGKVKSKNKAFVCIPSENPGFVKVSKEDYRYFEFDSGEFYYPLGFQLNWKGPVCLQLNYNHYFSKMAEAGINFTRSWDPAPALPKVSTLLSRTQRLGRQSLPDNWDVDELIETAEERGIYILRSLLNFWWFRNKEQTPGLWLAENPYSVAQGGICSEPDDWFTMKEARELYKRELRYIVARWGYSTNIFAWELWNEIDSSWGLQPYMKNVYLWHKEIGSYLKSIDPYKHPVTTSFGDPPNRIPDPVGHALKTSEGYPKKIWDLPEMDFLTYHMYASVTAPYPSVKGVLSTYKLFKMFNKPGIIGEFGLHWFNEGYQELYDLFGTADHYILWSSCMTPMAGTAARCSGFEVIDYNDFYFLYPPLVNFMKGEDRRGKNLRTADITINYPKLGVCGIQNEREAQFWIYSQDPGIAGERPDKGMPPFPFCKDVIVTISGLINGEYKVEFWDTWESTITGTEKIRTGKDGTLVIKISELDVDTAAKVKPLK